MGGEDDDGGIEGRRKRKKPRRTRNEETRKKKEPGSIDGDIRPSERAASRCKEEKPPEIQT